MLTLAFLTTLGCASVNSTTKDYIGKRNLSNVEQIVSQYNVYQHQNAIVFDRKDAIDLKGLTEEQGWKEVKGQELETLISEKIGNYFTGRWERVSAYFLNRDEKVKQEIANAYIKDAEKYKLDVRHNEEESNQSGKPVYDVKLKKKIHFSGGGSGGGGSGGSGGSSGGGGSGGASGGNVFNKYLRNYIANNGCLENLHITYLNHKNKIAVYDSNSNKIRIFPFTIQKKLAT